MYIVAKKNVTQGNSFETSSFVSRPFQLTLHSQSRFERKGEEQAKVYRHTKRSKELRTN